VIGDRNQVHQVYVVSYATGRGVLPPPDAKIRGSIQPATGEVLEDVGGGRRSRDVRVLRTQRRVAGVQPRSGKAADALVIDGGVFEVHEVRDWNHMLRYREIILVRRVENDAESSA